MGRSCSGKVYIPYSSTSNFNEKSFLFITISLQVTLLFFHIRTGLLFSCTSQEPAAATGLQEEEEGIPTPPPKSQKRRVRKWPRKETTEQIRDVMFQVGQSERSRRCVAFAASRSWIKGLHLALPVSAVEGFWSFLCLQPSLVSFVWEVSSNCGMTRATFSEAKVLLDHVNSKWPYFSIFTQ